MVFNNRASLFRDFIIDVSGVFQTHDNLPLSKNSPWDSGMKLQVVCLPSAFTIADWCGRHPALWWLIRLHLHESLKFRVDRQRLGSSWSSALFTDSVWQRGFQNSLFFPESWLSTVPWIVILLFPLKCVSFVLCGFQTTTENLKVTQMLICVWWWKWRDVDQWTICVNLNKLQSSLYFGTSQS